MCSSLRSTSLGSGGQGIQILGDEGPAVEEMTYLERIQNASGSYSTSHYSLCCHAPCVPEPSRRDCVGGWAPAGRRQAADILAGPPLWFTGRRGRWGARGGGGGAAEMLDYWSPDPGAPCEAVRACVNHLPFEIQGSTCSLHPENSPQPPTRQREPCNVCSPPVCCREEAPALALAEQPGQTRSCGGV